MHGYCGNKRKTFEKINTINYTVSFTLIIVVVNRIKKTAWDSDEENDSNTDEGMQTSSQFGVNFFFFVKDRRLGLKQIFLFIFIDWKSLVVTELRYSLKKLQELGGLAER